MQFEIFYEDQTKGFMQGDTKKILYITEYEQNFLLLHFNTFKQHWVL